MKSIYKILLMSIMLLSSCSINFDLSGTIHNEYTEIKSEKTNVKIRNKSIRIGYNFYDILFESDNKFICSNRCTDNIYYISISNSPLDDILQMVVINIDDRDFCKEHDFYMDNVDMVFWKITE